jgi:hypothetical protein
LGPAAGPPPPLVENFKISVHIVTGICYSPGGSSYPKKGGDDMATKKTTKKTTKKKPAKKK